MEDNQTKRTQEARAIINDAGSIAVLTGAGVSAESGVPTFRGSDGLWEGRDVLELASPEGFAKDPAFVWQFYNSRRDKLMEVKPNTGHYAIAELEGRVTHFRLITQNVDRLHQAAGSKKVAEVHGNIWESKCSGCEKVYDHYGIELSTEPKCDACGAWLRPNVVWFGEALPMEVFQDAESFAEQCDVLLVVGTSAVVYPAAGLIPVAKHAGAKVIEVNVEASGAPTDIQLIGKSATILPRLL